MATPHVAGAAALISSVPANSSLTAYQLKQRILSGADPLNDPSRQTVTNGRLNAFNALDNDTTPPAAVILAATASNLTSVTLSWTATGDDGLAGTASSYDVRYSSTSPFSWASATPVVGEPSPQPSGSAETFTVSDLDPSTTYNFAVKVSGNVGNESLLSNVATESTATGTVVFGDDMESGPGDWTATGLWHRSTCRWDSFNTSWYHGLEEMVGVCTSYDSGNNSGSLTSSAIDLTSYTSALLTYSEWSQLEASTFYDRTKLEVSTNGTTLTSVFESHGTNNAWVKRTVDLDPYVGGTVYIRFRFDTIDSLFNNYEGWYVDDVRVLANPSAPDTTPPAAPTGLVATAGDGAVGLDWGTTPSRTWRVIT